MTTMWFATPSAGGRGRLRASAMTGLAIESPRRARRPAPVPAAPVRAERPARRPSPAAPCERTPEPAVAA